MKKWLRLVVIVVTIGGGFAAGSQAITLLLHPQVVDASHVLLAFIAVAMSIFVMSSGLIFATDPTDVRLLIPALAIQLPYLSSSFLTYKFGVALPCFIIVGPPEDAGRVGLYGGFEALVGGRWKLSYGGDHPLRIGVNLTVCLLLILLWQARRSTQTDTPSALADKPIAPVAS
jgi:hypothetical protein